MKEPTQQYSDTIKSLQSRIQALEDENRLLKERLEEAGVSYADIVSGDAEGVVELYDPDQGARIKGIQAGYPAFDKGAYEWDRSK